MKNKGFTLIELLAVIVILAIIALIATPIILGIINNAKKESNERSVELYSSAIKNAVVRYQMNNDKVLSGNFTSSKGGKVLTSKDDENLKLNIDYDGNVVCETIEILPDGRVFLDNCKVNGEDVNTTLGKEDDFIGTKACSYTEDKDGYEMVECGSERFYVMSKDEMTGTVTMLTEYNLDVGNYFTSNTHSSKTPISNPTGIQDSNALGEFYDDSGNRDISKIYGVIAFSTINYWASDVDNHPAYIYGDYKNSSGVQQNLIYDHVVNYESYLKNVLEVSSAKATLMSLEQATLMGCDINKLTCGPDRGSGVLEDPAPEWMWKTSYWLGFSHASSVTGDYGVSNIESTGSFGSGRTYSDSVRLGVRPVITISFDEIN